jgi:hypothetical protein
VKTVSIFFITVALIGGMVGCGSPSQNLEIRTWYDLDAVRNNLGGNHTLMNDLDSTTLGYEELAGPTANKGKGWQPIGVGGMPWGMFTGTFDGHGYEVCDLFINRADENRVGLFSYAYRLSHIQNIGVVNITVTGRDWVGSLVGDTGGSISSAYSTGSVTGEEHVGGLAGRIGTMNNSYSNTSVTANYEVGGLVGSVYETGTVNNSYSTGSVTGMMYVGGLVGKNKGTVSTSYFSGKVTGDWDVGGLVGENLDTVNNSYSTGIVTGLFGIGGLVGKNGGTVTKSYATGRTTGDDADGGLLGWGVLGGTSNSFWDTETSGQATSLWGSGKSTTEMQDIATFSGAGWNITAVAPGERNTAYVWNIVDGQTYPFLSWQSVS